MVRYSKFFNNTGRILCRMLWAHSWCSKMAVRESSLWRENPAPLWKENPVQVPWARELHSHAQPLHSVPSKSLENRKWGGKEGNGMVQGTHPPLLNKHWEVSKSRKLCDQILPIPPPTSHPSQHIPGRHWWMDSKTLWRPLVCSW